MRFLTLSVVLLISQLLWAQVEIPPKPTDGKDLVFDYAQLMSENEVRDLNEKLINYEDTTSTQIVIISIPSLNGEDINLLAAEWGEKWGVGQENSDNGLVILLAKDDRKVSIQNGYGLEPYMTDAKSKRIIEEYMIPHFRQGDYYAGFLNGINAIDLVIKGKFKEEGFDSHNDGNELLVILFVIFFIVILFTLLAILFGKKNGGNRGNKGGWGDVILTDFGSSTWSSGGSSWGGGSSGGGGFGGFGGGSFGGGGASGGW